MQIDAYGICTGAALLISVPLSAYFTTGESEAMRLALPPRKAVAEMNCLLLQQPIGLLFNFVFENDFI